MTHVPYKGAGPVLKDLLGGQIDLAFDSGTGLPWARAGKLRLLAAAASRRRGDFPDVPTLEEASFKGVDGGPHFAFRSFHFPLAASPAEGDGEDCRRALLEADW